LITPHGGAGVHCGGAPHGHDSEATFGDVTYGGSQNGAAGANILVPEMGPEMVPEVIEAM